MATPLDVSLLQQFGGVFPFLLVMVLVYAILSATAFFRERQGTAAMIALLAAIMTLFSPIAMKTINLMAPWFVLFVIFIVLFILAFMVFGYSQEDIMKVVTSGDFGIGQWIMAIMLIIGLGSLAAVFEEEVGFRALEESGEAVEGDGTGAGFFATLFHPKILGMALLLLIAFFGVKYMAKGD